MADHPNLNKRPFAVGANHRSCGLSVRDRLFIEDADVPGFLENLKAQGIGEALVLSTCDRVEVQGMHDDPSGAISGFAKHYPPIPVYLRRSWVSRFIC